MDNQTALDQHFAIFVATLDYFLNPPIPRVIVDQHDFESEYYGKLRQRAEKHYRNGNLRLLQRVIRVIAGMAPLFREEGFLAYMKERTGYDAEIVKQVLPARQIKNPNSQITVTEYIADVKKLAEQISPDNKRKITIREISSPPDQFMTTVDLRFERSRISVYTVNGIDLDINVYWKDNNTVVIETRGDYVALSHHGEWYQCEDDVVKVKYVIC